MVKGISISSSSRIDISIKTTAIIVEAITINESHGQHQKYLVLLLYKMNLYVEEARPYCHQNVLVIEAETEMRNKHGTDQGCDSSYRN